ncbi:MAG: YeeE/YedE family protein [Phycisphaeraceae bacterium]|nr:YeeE/YedE family protein [Phycisphaeraceae bacterium]
MYDPIFADPRSLVLGAVTGLVFGFLLVRGGVTRYQVILGQFLLRDFTVLKVMGTAIVVGAVGIFAMRAWGMDIPVTVRSAQVYGNVLGGVIFGVGMTLLGYCPGTAVAAAGDGSRHALYGIVGGVFGAAIYAETHAWVNEKILRTADLGKITLFEVAHVSPWWVIAAMAAAAVIGFTLLERKERRSAAA